MYSAPISYLFAIIGGKCYFLTAISQNKLNWVLKDLRFTFEVNAQEKNQNNLMCKIYSEKLKNRTFCT
jgi:nitroimidazol reductase NimA-like FMN-containing flavoprotein (pyridoxamine 5'-phosphate oxidase superfamily)